VNLCSAFSMGPNLFHKSVIKGVSTVAAVVLVFSAVAIAQGVLDTFRNPRLKTSAGYAIDLEYSQEMVLTVVKNVASNSVIRGTRIYRKDQENLIDGAEFAASSNAFKDSPASGQVFYKVRKNAVAPDHFPGSSGGGTITVRYVVQAVEGQPIHLRIDAVYLEDSLRTRYFSDGSVEAAEYDQVQTQLNAFTAPANSGTPPAQSEAQSQDSAEPQSALAKEQAMLADARAAEQKLQEQLKQLQFNTQGRIKSLTVPLKSYPYDSSSTILTLDKEERVTVLATSRYWYRIRTPKGEEGWIYYMFLEALQ